MYNHSNNHYIEMKSLVCAITFAVSLWVVAVGQQAGTVKPENHPPITVQSCTKNNGCQTESRSVVLDANWRWVHNINGYTNCYTGTSWNSAFCTNNTQCAENCALDGADYKGTYGISSYGSSLKLNFITNGNAGSRVYLLDSENEYQLFKLKNREFTFDVDVSKLPCGLNGALYLVQMDGDGGMSRFPGNKAGPKFGTGYCDAQCPQDIKFIDGEANVEGWNPRTSTGSHGTCCTEMDLWEANSEATAYTPHPCTVTKQTRCEGDSCSGTGYCDEPGCDFNPYRLGDKTFFGPSSNFTINTMQPFTVVTQFVTNDGTDNGVLSEIRRVWVQNGKVIQSSNVTVGGQQYNSVTDDFCNAQKQEFGDDNEYEKRGGEKTVGEALENGMVLVMSIWDDHAAYMLWLDSDYPLDKSSDAPGVARGPCPTTSGRPHDVETQHPDASVTFSNIKYGEIGSTY